MDFSGRPNRSSDWEDYRDIIQGLYVTEDRSLPDVVAEMKRRCNFVATERQYKRRISEWHLDKNVKDDEMRAIIATEAMRLRQGKKSVFYVRGRPVSQKKIDRFVQRKRIDRNTLDRQPGMLPSTNTGQYPVSGYASALPANVRCSTPPSDEPLLLDFSENPGRERSDRGPIPAEADTMVTDTTTSTSHDLDYRLVQAVHDPGTRSVVPDHSLGPTGSFHPTGIDRNSINGTVSRDRQSKYGSLSSVEGTFLKNFSCCGATLASLHEFLQHYEAHHAHLGEQSRNSDDKPRDAMSDMTTLTADDARSREHKQTTQKPSPFIEFESGRALLRSEKLIENTSTGQRIAHPNDGPPAMDPMGDRDLGTELNGEQINANTIERTLSDIYQDELYDTSSDTGALPGPIGHYPQQSPKNSMLASLLQAAQIEHVEARSVPPLIGTARGRSPFAPASPYANERFSHSTPNSPAQLNTAARLREQQKATDDARVIAEHQSSPSEFVTPRTISPKESTTKRKKAAKLPLPVMTRLWK
ncbi:MAG: hypothetical protein Q9168_006150 [Polycauliona sp. 1 TL-2023]